MEIVVVTDVPEHPNFGNLAIADLDTVVEMRSPRWENDQWQEGVYQKLDPQVLLELRQQVFRVGEVLILDEGGREIGYPGRKPDKWSVTVTPVPTLEDARELAQRTMHPKQED